MKESKTAYAYLIEHMQEPSFLKVWDIAYDFIRNIPSELCDELHESLNRGVDVLDSEPLLQMYIYAFGKMHNAKLIHAFNHLQDRVIKSDQIEIVDYGCGQGLASLCYHDFIKEHNPLQQITKITLIEPSPLALSRAELLCSCFYPDAEIIAVNKSFDDLTTEDINISSKVLTLHLFSNILDVESYDLHHLIQTITNLLSERNEYVIVSPIQNTLRTQRLKIFASNIGGFIYYENYLDKRQLNEERDWTCAVLLCSSITKQELDESECDQVFEEALSYFDKKDNNLEGGESVALLHRLKYCAELGDKRCQNQLGAWYLKGIGTEQDYSLALKWFQKAAEQNYAAAFSNIGNIYQKGLGVEVDNQKAVQYYKKGSDQKHSDSQCRLGICYLNGKGIDTNKNIALSLFTESSLQGYAPAMFMLYECYLNGWGTGKDENAAIEYLKKNKIGALIVIERDVSLQDYISPATKVYADLTSPLLGTIFFPNSPLHDGGVIVQGDRITCAGAVFKTSMDPNLNKKLGTRHRAALGIAEESDAIALIVSEETGRISIAVDHEIHYNLSLDEFRMMLVEELKPKTELFYDADGAEREGEDDEI